MSHRNPPEETNAPIVRMKGKGTITPHPLDTHMILAPIPFDRGIALSTTCSGMMDTDPGHDALRDQWPGKPLVPVTDG